MGKGEKGEENVIRRVLGAVTERNEVASDYAFDQIPYYWPTSWDKARYKKRAPPSMRSTAYISRQTARKLLEDTLREMRSKAASSRALGFDGDAADMDKWAEAVEDALELTLGG